MTDRSDTLIIVTADHSHTMTINGYPVRGSDLLGMQFCLINTFKLFAIIKRNSFVYLGLTGDRGIDAKPYTTLSYANGPGYVNGYGVNGGNRVDLTSVDTSKIVLPI